MKKSTVDNIIIMTIINGPESSRLVKLTIKTYSTTLTFFYMFQNSTVIVYSTTFKPAVVV